MFPPGAKSWHAYKNPRISCHTAPYVYKYDLTLSYLPVGIKTQETNTNADTLATAIVWVVHCHHLWPRSLMSLMTTSSIHETVSV